MAHMAPCFKLIANCRSLLRNASISHAECQVARRSQIALMILKKKIHVGPV